LDLPPTLRKPSILAVSRDSVDFDRSDGSRITLLRRAPVATFESSQWLGVREKRGNFYVAHEPADRGRVGPQHRSSHVSENLRPRNWTIDS
jgi:hypothetical protein